MKWMWLSVVLALGCNAGGTVVDFELEADFSQQPGFYRFPYPSDLRLGAGGSPDLRGFPNGSGNTIVDSLAQIAADRPGFPVVPVAYFRFSAPLPPLDPETIIPASIASPILLIDVDPASEERGRLRPTVAATPEVDDYVPENLLAVAPRPGFVLVSGRTYAMVVLRSLGDAAGRRLAVAETLATLERGGTPDGARGAAARELYHPLWETLRTLGIDPTEVAAATVFTTGDVVADTARLSTALLQRYQVEITGLKVDYPNGADQQDRFCELTGTVAYPQFQTGHPPFGTGGLFEFTDAGLPAKQRDELAPIVITLPRGTMPAGGYPLMIYFHGSGGVSTQVVDRGAKASAGGDQANGQGPSYVVAPFGLATAASALPLNPERLPGANDIQYLNFNNLAAFRDTFRQGVIEQRLFLEALRTLQISPSVAAACTGVSLPPGETAFHFDASKLVAMGQSMGGMYTNLIGAVEPRIRAAIPAGAGGFWSMFMLKTTLIKGLPNAVAGIINSAPLTFLHPALQLLETAWEPADPIVYMPRLGRRPLDGQPRPIYEPVGKDDSYFPTQLYDAIALSYEHQEAGDVVWPTMQAALSLDALDGIMSYPVAQNRAALPDGKPYTGVIVQYAGDGFSDPHAISFQLDAVKYQYGCFLSTFLGTGIATVPAPAPLGTPCPR